MVSAVLQGRDTERHSSRALGIPHLLHKLAQAPDFYVEMKWEFTSWGERETVTHNVWILVFPIWKIYLTSLLYL